MAKLKGHAVIELTDVKTGKKERVEHNNILTKGIEKMLNAATALIGGEHIANILTPIKDHASCGILLFNNTLTATTDNYQMPDPTTAKLTGYAGAVTSDGLDTMRGDFNANESGAITNGYKFVWDFGTDDANGEIAALALTNEVLGYHGYHYNRLLIQNKNATGTGNTEANYKGLPLPVVLNELNKSDTNIGSNITKVEEDSAGNVIYTDVKFISSTEIQIAKFQITLTALAQDKNIGTIELLTSETVTVNEPNYVNDDANMLFLEDNGVYYGVFCTEGGTIRHCKLTATSHEYTQITTTPASAYSKTLRGITRNLTKAYSGTLAVARNGYLYAFAEENTRYSCSVIKINLNNFSEYEILANTYYADEGRNHYGFYGNFVISKTPNGTIYTAGAVIDLNDGVTQIDVSPLMNSSYGGLDREFIAGGLAIINKAYSYNNSNSSMYYNYIFLYPNMLYLATINNLDAPVTKTAAKTMKITYTLTYAE